MLSPFIVAFSIESLAKQKAPMQVQQGGIKK